ncbi:MAG TPA: lysine--tRNA ligase [Candidatus Bathyarchaeia archaeon]|nr:lysine--tRNA ligase [Candidatus Bathyarchaeia archaeon]
MSDSGAFPLGQEREQRRAKLARLREIGVPPYAYRFPRTHSTAEAAAAEAELTASGSAVSIAGRVMALRGHGHTAFGHIKDRSGKIQFYIRDDEVSGRDFEIFRLVDIGDIIGLTGKIFRTKTGELTLRVSTLELLSKAINPLPEKWHGLQDKEIRYRRRYVDLIVNDDVYRTFLVRSRIVEAVRRFLLAHDFVEVETPILQPLYGGALARPFVTHHNALDVDLYLRIADELYLKRLIVGGMERVFEFSKDFRNEGMDRSHNPEFTMLECYAAFWDYTDMMSFVEELFTTLSREILGGTTVTYGAHTIDLAPPWRRLAYFDAIREAVGIDLRGADAAELNRVARARGLDAGEAASRGELLDLIFSELVEPGLIRPTFVMDYPIEISPLAKRHRSEAGVVERFEPYVAGFEVGNAFSELNDPEDQRERFETIARTRDADSAETHPVDEDYIRALEYGMPPTSGLGVGIDRLVMLLTNSASIRDVILFPQMRPEEGREKE